MFFHISIHRIKAHRISDHPLDPFDRSIELYQTWHLAALQRAQRDVHACGEAAHVA